VTNHRVENLCNTETSLAMNPSSRLTNPNRALSAELVWEADPEDVMWLRAWFDGDQIYLRINNFPDDNLYSLWVGDGQFVELEEMPNGWSRSGPLSWPPTARRRRA